MYLQRLSEIPMKGSVVSATPWGGHKKQFLYIYQ